MVPFSSQNIIMISGINLISEDFETIVVYHAKGWGLTVFSV